MHRQPAQAAHRPRRERLSNLPGQYRYAKSVTALGRPLEGGAGRAIWGWFIPIANDFIAPNQLLRAAKETDRARGGSGVAPGTSIP